MGKYNKINLSIIFIYLITIFVKARKKEKENITIYYVSRYLSTSQIIIKFRLNKHKKIE
mgnify:CR=1 FL=1